MANTYRRLGIDLLATGGTDIRVKVTVNDTNSGFLNDKVVGAASGKITTAVGNPNSNETLQLDIVDSLIDHDQLLNFEADEHRQQDDAVTSTTTLWSSQKIQDELDGKVNQITPVADNRLLKSVGTTGVDMEQTAITVDDSGNVTGIQDLVVSGDLIVNGTTTSVNSSTLEVTDANITVNNSGTQASADLATAGLTVEMSDATDAVIGYDSTLTSKFKAGESGDLREIATTTHTQALTNKTIDADSNTLSNLEVDNFKSTAIDLDDTLSAATDDKLPTSLTVKNYADSLSYTAAEISYDNTDSTLSATNVKLALDELDTEKLNISDFSSTFDTNLGTKTTDDLNEGLTNLYYTDLRARTAAVVNSTAGNETDQAPSVDAIKTYIATEISNVGSAGDINETSFSATAGATNANVTGLSFAGTVQSAKALVSVYRDADSDLYEVYDLLLVNIGSDWEIAYSSLGQSSGIDFDVNASGQVTYTDINTPTGHVSTTIKFRAITTTN